jgi:hypothetical protein
MVNNQIDPITGKKIEGMVVEEVDAIKEDIMCRHISVKKKVATIGGVVVKKFNEDVNLSMDNKLDITSDLS